MARRKPPTTHGLAVVDKPAGVTSHDVVGMLRRRFDERQVGHAGTLDPDATGVLLVGVGKATRLLRFLTALGKTLHGRRRAGHLDVDARFQRRGHRHVRHVGRHRRHGSGRRRRAPDRADHADPADGQRSACRRQAAARTGTRRASRSSVSRGRSPCTRSTSRRPTIRRYCASRCGARQARTSARWPTISGGCWVAVRTCAICAARRSAASSTARLDRPTSAS